MKKMTLKPMALVLAALCVMLGAGVALYSPSSTAADDAKDKNAAQQPALPAPRPSRNGQPAHQAASNGNVRLQEAVIVSEANGLR